jgi:hypothetical protein
MTKGHLDTTQLLAIYHGDTEDFAALEHLASCSDCRKAFDDSRWVSVLRRSSELVETGPHLDQDELHAFRHSALSSARVAQIERHLRSCSRCLALYQRGRARESALDYMSPAPTLIRKARRAFRPGKLRWLGTVLVTGLRHGPKAILLPERRVASGSTLFAGESPLPARGVRARERSHPGSARRRAKRLKRVGSIRQPSVEELEATRNSAVRFLREQSFEAGAGLPTAGEPLRVSADDWDVLIGTPSDEDPEHVTVQLIAVGHRRPAHGVRVLLRRSDGKQAEATTDESGRASLPVARGRSRIVVEAEPPLALSLDLLD